MNKTRAHLLLGVFDLAALAACWWAWSELHQLSLAVSAAVQPIQVQRPVGLLAVAVMVPVVHGICSIPWRGKWSGRAGAVLVVLGTLTLSGVWWVDAAVEKRLIAAEYHRCPGKTRQMTVSKFETWAYEREQCGWDSRLTSPDTGEGWSREAAKIDR